MEKLAADKMILGIDGHCKVIPKLKPLVAPIITTFYNLQDTKGYGKL